MNQGSDNIGYRVCILYNDVRCRGKPACLPICGDIRNTNVGALPATPIRHDMHNMRRCVAGRTSLHKGKHHGEQGRHAGLPLHGHTDMAVAKSAIGVTALGALQATPLQSCPRTPMMESPHDVGADLRVCPFAAICNDFRPIRHEIYPLCGKITKKCRKTSTVVCKIEVFKFFFR